VLFWNERNKMIPSRVNSTCLSIQDNVVLPMACELDLTHRKNIRDIYIYIFFLKLRKSFLQITLNAYMG